MRTESGRKVGIDYSGLTTYRDKGIGIEEPSWATEGKRPEILEEV